MEKQLKIILASASPRRHELLDMAGIEHEVIVSSADESSVAFVPGHPEKYVMEISLVKNRAVSEHLAEAGSLKNDCVVISADTLVYCPETDLPLGKPKDEKDAFRMLKLLSGSTHSVITGVTIVGGSDTKPDTFYSLTKVTFRELDDTEIGDYVRSGEPMDKAGAYGIQGKACRFVERIDGDYYNVVGLPVCEIVSRLKKYGIRTVYTKQESRC